MSDTINKKKVKAIIHKIGLRHGLPDSVIEEVVKSPYAFAEIKLRELSLMNIESEEELEKTKTNFLFKHLGRLYVKYSSIEGKRNRIKTINKLNAKKNGGNG